MSEQIIIKLEEWHVEYIVDGAVRSDSQKLDFPIDVDDYTELGPLVAALRSHYPGAGFVINQEF